SSCLDRLSLMRRCAPSCTLFPYTTLFRSCQHDRGAGIVTAAEDDPGAGAADGAVEGGAVGAHPAVDRERGIHAGAGGVGDGGVQDRKSTRLNSSHVKSSYAVFCLKKKNTS